MAYEFKKLSEVEALDAVPEGASVLAEVDGAIKRVPGEGLGGSGTIPVFDLAAMGLPVVPPNRTYVNVECDTTALREAAGKGLVKLKLDTMVSSELTLKTECVFAPAYNTAADIYAFSNIMMMDTQPIVGQINVANGLISAILIPIAPMS